AKARRHPLEPAGVAVGIVDHDRNDENVAWTEPSEAVERMVPLGTEIAFLALLGVLRQNRDQQPAVVDLAQNLRVIGGAASQSFGIEPDREAGGFEPGLERERGIAIGMAVADEQRFGVELPSRCARCNRLRFPG